MCTERERERERDPQFHLGHTFRSERLEQTVWYPPDPQSLKPKL